MPFSFFRNGRRMVNTAPPSGGLAGLDDAAVRRDDLLRNPKPRPLPSALVVK